MNLEPREWSWLVRVLAGAAVAAGLAAPAAWSDEKSEAKAAADRAKAAVALFKKTKDGKDPSTRLEAIERIAAEPHKSTIAAVGKYVRDPRPGVAAAAAAALARMGKTVSAKDRAGALKALGGGLGVKGKSNETAVACCGALAQLGDARGASLLLPLLKDKDPERAAAAVAALGGLKALAAVDGLIGLLAGVEPPAAKGGGNAKAASQTEAQKARTGALQQPCHDALGKITGASHKSAAEWKKWWKANKAKLLAAAKRAEAEARAAEKKQAAKPAPKEADEDDDEGGMPGEDEDGR